MNYLFKKKNIYWMMDLRAKRLRQALEQSVSSMGTTLSPHTLSDTLRRLRPPSLTMPSSKKRWPHGHTVDASFRYATSVAGMSPSFGRNLHSTFTLAIKKNLEKFN